MNHPKLGLWRSRGVTDEELDQIKIAAEEVQVTENEYMEEESRQAIRELFENAKANTDDMFKHQEKDLWQADRKLLKSTEANTNDIINVVNIIKDKPTPPQTQNGLIKRSEEIEKVRTQPAGMRASVDLIYHWKNQNKEKASKILRPKMIKTYIKANIQRPE